MIKYTEYKTINNGEEKIKIFFRKTPFGRFMLDRKFDENKSLELEFTIFNNYMEKSNVIVAHNKNDEIVGLIGYHLSDWDSVIFQKKVAMIQYFLVQESSPTREYEVSEELLNCFHNWVKANGIEIAITKLDTQYFSPVYILQKNGYILYECVTYRTLDNLKNFQKIGVEIEFRYANKMDKKILREIAQKSTFPKSHFYLDPNFDRTKIESMYATWIENALNAKQKLVLIEKEMQIAGVFLYDVIDYSLQFGKKMAVWKSAMVEQNFRSQGVGFNLFKATLQACIDDGVDCIDSSLAEKNILSQSFHDRLGFRIVNTRYTLHKWFLNN